MLKKKYILKRSRLCNATTSNLVRQYFESVTVRNILGKCLAVAFILAFNYW